MAEEPDFLPETSKHKTWSFKDFHADYQPTLENSSL